MQECRPQHPRLKVLPLIIHLIQFHKRIMYLNLMFYVVLLEFLLDVLRTRPSLNPKLLPKELNLIAIPKTG